MPWLGKVHSSSSGDYHCFYIIEGCIRDTRDRVPPNAALTDEHHVMDASFMVRKHVSGRESQARGSGRSGRVALHGLCPAPPSTRVESASVTCIAVSGLAFACEAFGSWRCRQKVAGTCSNTRVITAKRAATPPYVH
jgi:hypothetical protein